VPLGGGSPLVDVGILRGAARLRDGAFDTHAAKNLRRRQRLFDRPALARRVLHSAFCLWPSHRRETAGSL
jgi:hypothetical protein